MKKIGISLLGMFFFGATAWAADPAYYWNFNNFANPLASNIGGASAEVLYLSVGPGTVYLGTGTEVNALTLGASPNYSLGAGGVADAYQLEIVTFKDLDFTNISGGGISFASRTRQISGLEDHFSVSYKIGAGSWSSPISLANPTATWTPYFVLFGGVLDGNAQVQIRLTYSDAITALDLHDIDNVQIIPEPSSFALMLMAVVIMSGLLRSRARKLSPIFRSESSRG